MKVLDLVKAVIKTLIGFFVDVFAISVMVLFTFGLILEVLYFDAKLVFKSSIAVYGTVVISSKSRMV